MTFGKWTPTLEAIDKLQLEMYAKKEIIKELERTLQLFKKPYTVPVEFLIEERIKELKGVKP